MNHVGVFTSPGYDSGVMDVKVQSCDLVALAVGLVPDLDARGSVYVALGVPRVTVITRTWDLGNFKVSTNLYRPISRI